MSAPLANSLASGRERFAWKPFLKMLFSLAIPVALQNLLTTTGSMVDTIMIASLGKTTVGAVGLCAQFASLLFSCYWGFNGGGILFFSQYWGAKDEDGICRAYGSTLTCLMTVALTFCGFSVIAPELVMRVYTDKPAIQAIGVQYLRIVGFSYPFMVYSIGMSSLMRCTGQVRIPLLGSIVSVCSNIVLNYIFIFGKLGLPAMGVRGAALATVCASIINTLVLIVFVKVRHFPFIFQLSKHFRWSFRWIREYLHKCFPIICNEFLIGLGNMVINIVLGRQSEQAIAAIAVFRTLEGLFIGFFAGFASASSVLVGNPIGAGDLDTAYERAKRLVLMCAGCIFTVCLCVLAAHGPILHAMGLDGESFEIGTGILTIYSVISVIRLSNWCMNDTYRASGDTAYGTILEIVFMYIMVLPLVCLSGLVWKFPILLLFVMCYVDEPIRSAMMIHHLFSGKWIKPVTVQGRDALPAFLAKHSRHKKEQN